MRFGLCNIRLIDCEKSYCIRVYLFSSAKSTDRFKKPLNIGPTLPICKVYICLLLARSLGRGQNRYTSVYASQIMSFMHFDMSAIQIQIPKSTWDQAEVMSFSVKEIAEFGMRISVFWSWLPLPSFVTLASYFTFIFNSVSRIEDLN